MNIDNYNLNYSTKSTLTGTSEVDVNLVLNNNKPSYNGGVKGKVTDKDKNPIKNATVKIFDQNFVPFMHTVTNDDGTYEILNVPTGNYKINATALGYIYNASSQVFVPEVDYAVVDFTLDIDNNFALNTIAGLLYVDGTKNPISNAKIVVKDGSNNVVLVTNSADDGEFLITDLIDGTYTIETILSGYKSLVVNTFTVTGGAIYNVILYMINVTVDIKGTYTGQILDSTGKPIFGAVVGLYSITQSGERLVYLTKTNLEGRYMFGNVPEGDYVVKSKNIGASATTNGTSNEDSSQSNDTDSPTGDSGTN